MSSTIYRVKCKTSDDCYIGVTNNYNQRMSQHKYESVNHSKKLSTFIREHGGWDNFECEKIIEFNYTKPEEKHRIERFYFDFYKPTLNTYTPNRTSLQYYHEVVKPQRT